jgi:hypothetical protein
MPGTTRLVSSRRFVPTRHPGVSGVIGRSVAAESTLLGSCEPARRTVTINLDTVIGSNANVIIAVLVALVILIVIVVVYLVRRVRSLDRRLYGLTRGADGRSLEAVLDAHLEKVFAVARTVDEVEARTAVLEGAARRAFSRVGLVRFNPFEDTGGNQSFALALLDAEGDGWVLSSLHARGGTRVYAKAIVRGRSDAALSEEESRAIDQATSGRS